MDANTAAQLLGPRYSWSIHTEPVKRMIDYITALEAKLCQCPPSLGGAGVNFDQGDRG